LPTRGGTNHGAAVALGHDSTDTLDRRAGQAFEWAAEVVGMHPAQRALREVENITYPRVEVADDGTRTVRDAVNYIKVNFDWLRPTYPEMIRSDGLVQLDSAGEFVYRRLRPLAGPFYAYERV
jgi:hypothetical protein